MTIETKFTGVQIRINSRESKEFLDSTIELAKVIAQLGMRSTGKTGRRYKRPNGKTHIASSAGKYPAIDRGKLWRSLDTKVVDDYTAELGTPLKHGKSLEEGTKNMKARPFIRPSIIKAVEENKKNFNFDNYLEIKK